MVMYDIYSFMGNQQTQAQSQPSSFLEGGIVSAIVNDQHTQDLLKRHNLRAQSVTWEDTARTNGSCWGANISDMTLVVNDSSRGRLMPVIRSPNFSDHTDDVPIENFRLLLGNDDAVSPKRIVTLAEYLDELRLFHRERDSVVLTSSQCCVIPVDEGTTDFAVQLFNYQSLDNDPAVLVILVSKDGTSTQVVQKSNQKLFFNDKGTARWFSAERLQDFRERKTGVKEEKIKSHTEMKSEEKIENTIMMIQVPLEVKPRELGMGSKVKFESAPIGPTLCCDSSSEDDCGEGGMFAGGYSGDDELCNTTADFSSTKIGAVSSRKIPARGMDMGMIGLGSEAGAFIGTNGLTLKRDMRFPVRCTFQYYRVTDQSNIDEQSVQDIAAQISQAAAKAVASGSLVTEVDTSRITEPDLANPNLSDTPGKLDEREYLWGENKMAGFL